MRIFMEYTGNSSKLSFIPYIIGTVFIFTVTFAIAATIGGDYISHREWAAELSLRNLPGFMQNYAAYPLWHFVTKSIYRIFRFSLCDSAAITTALCNCFAYWSLLWVWDFFIQRPLSPLGKAFWGACLMIVGPLYLPVFNPDYLLGQGSGNAWHNPTNIAVKGFTILCFALIIQLLDSQKSIREERKTYILLSILLFFSALAKPSFLQGMIPGLGLYFIISLLHNRRNFAKYCAIAGTFIPAAGLLLFQLTFSFFTDTAIHSGGGIGIEFGRCLKLYTPSLFISFLLAFAFPLFVLALDFKNLIKKTAIQAVLCYELCAWAESAFLYEIGERERHGNWIWGSYLSMFVVWMLFTFEYFDIISVKTGSKIRRNIGLYGGGILLFLHIAFGLLYCFSLINEA